MNGPAHLIRRCFAVLLLCGGGASGFGAESTGFSERILPILSEHCFPCHGPDAKEGRKGDLRLDQEADAKRIRDHGGIIINPGNPDGSELMARILSEDPDEVMPPLDSHRPLTAEQKTLLREWIQNGAVWGGHWAFETIPPPDPQVPAHGENPIDFLVKKNWERQPEPRPPLQGEAPRETLLRRLALDVTGLPPTAEQRETFRRDTTPGAWERAVDRYLADPAYGERMAWEWLDAARYADSNGFQGDAERTMWPWRDWVATAFNRNQPFDEFTIWQIAGDLLPNATREQILATAFLRNHMINGEGGRIPEENRVDYVLDMTDTVGTVWLGLTLGCARCHDHKYDPLSQREYFQLTAFFNQTPVDGTGGDPQTPPVLEWRTNQEEDQINLLASRMDEMESRIRSRREELALVREDWERTKSLENPPSDWTPLRPIEVRAEGQTLSIEPDNVILASGPNPATDTYQLRLAGSESPIAALKLTAIPHPSMTFGGLARSDSGNFVLTSLEVWDETEKRIEFQGAEATYEQGGYAVGGAIDANPQSGWAVWNGEPLTKEVAAVFRLKNPIPPQPGRNLSVTLKFESPHISHNLGHFRISAAQNPAAGLDDPGDLRRLIAKPVEARTKEEKAILSRAQESEDQELRGLEAELADLRPAKSDLEKKVARVMVMGDRPEPRDTFVLDRGLYSAPLEKVTAGTPAWLPPLPEGTRRDRLALARWIVAPENPLTARVIVNRLWQQIFGIGLVNTPQDFGLQGEKPPQRELLDWLAADFVRSGWDVKRLLRLIYTSETYRRNSAAGGKSYQLDPANRLLSRGARFRLPSWMIRDQALAVSGLLQRDFGGRAVFPYQPDGVWEEATFGNKKYPASKPEDLHRRSLYTFWRRIVGPTGFFDSARRQVCEVGVSRTNTPAQALITLNDITFVESARALAVLVLKSAPDDSSRIQLLGPALWARPLRGEEAELIQKSLDRARESFQNDPASAAAFLSHGETSRPDEFPPAELAAWSALTLTLLNLDETLTKE